MGRILYDISQDYMGVIQKSRLFSGIEPDEANGMSKCLEITFREYDKEEVIFNEGDKISKIGMVIQGNVSIEKADYWGNRPVHKRKALYRRTFQGWQSCYIFGCKMQ